ncbi:hypothetical protein X474_11165 [Dethiosulfatarculus sandiegensis]|uniref:Uncharacterized protein n=1 Tax=Dethiosulfatarculus sandiegensis TaxID=1429043 RepID=A0A0D2HTL3_9BACT|nr:hypothetical protein X474_11165 [Dethiosulfatarculus sandiegensis]
MVGFDPVYYFIYAHAGLLLHLTGAENHLRPWFVPKKQGRVFKEKEETLLKRTPLLF